VFWKRQPEELKQFGFQTPSSFVYENVHISKKNEKKEQVLQTRLVATRYHRIMPISSLAGTITGRKKYTNA
jgi:hypothetical protein